MYLKQKIYVDYSDRFHYMSADAFYSQEKIAIDKINLNTNLKIIKYSKRNSKKKN